MAVQNIHLTEARLNQAYYFDPGHPQGQPLNYDRVWRLLKQDPRLEYKVENDQVYVLANGVDLSLIVPKDRDIPEQYPPKESTLLNPAFRFLGLALLGLPLAGLGPLIFVPLAIGRVLQLYAQGLLDQADRVRAVVVLILAAVLLGPAFILNFLFFLHL